MLRPYLIFFVCFFSWFSHLQASENELPALNALSTQTSVSGLSSGGFMAAQFHVAYSKDLIGAGVVAGGPWNCAGNNPLVPPLTNAVTTCMDPCAGNWFYEWFGCPSWMFPNSSFLSTLAQSTAEDGDIDPLQYLHQDKVYIFSGQNDKTVLQGVVDTTQAFYEILGITEQNLYYNDETPAGHAFITDDPSHNSCETKSESPYINHCDLPLAHEILEHIYGTLNPPAEEPTGSLILFDQTQFFESSLTSLNELAYVYVPQTCFADQCKVHVSLHGCRQGISVLGNTYIEETGYLETADTNNLIILFPQVKPSPTIPYNPRGCWDFWGYTTNSTPPFNYYKKEAPQMVAIKKMIDRLMESNEQTAKAEVGM